MKGLEGFFGFFWEGLVWVLGSFFMLLFILTIVFMWVSMIRIAYLSWFLI